MILSRRQARLLVSLGIAVSLSLPGDQTLYAVLPTQAGTVGISLGLVGVLLGINYIYLMTFFAGNGVVMSTISLYLKQNFGDQVLIGDAAVGVASLGGLLLAMRSLTGMMAGPISGHLSDRRGNRQPIVRGGIIIGGIGFAILIVGGNI
jgi:hypothetical protein